jgi:hypothetical protein
MCREKVNESQSLLKLWVVPLSSRKKEAYKCYRCPEIDCLNLYDHLEKHENVGGELYIYELLGKRMQEKYGELNRYVCKNGSLLRITCFLVDPVVRMKEESYLKDVLNQSARDLKASMFLAFSGHYRQAMQVLRCSFENLISGVYFHSELCRLRSSNSSKEAFAKLAKRFDNWKKSGRVNVRASIEISYRIGFLTLDEAEEWKKLYSNLSRFIHTPEEHLFVVKHEDVLKDFEVTCSSTTYFSEDSLKSWSASFEKVFLSILKIIVAYHPFSLRTQSGKIAVNQLRDVEEKFGIAETKLRELYSQIKSM